MICYFIFAVILGGFGALCYLQANSLHDLLIQYDVTCSGQAVCALTFVPTADLVNPKIYYQLDNFYANHRNFVKSKSYKQLRGNVMDAGSLGTCSPVTYMSDLGNSIPSVAIDGTNLRSDSVAFPCGLIAKYMFNDAFTMATTSTGQSIAIDETNIAH